MNTIFKEMTSLLRQILTSNDVQHGPTTFEIISSFLWRYHRELAKKNNIDTKYQWFPVLCDKEIEYELQRTAISVLMKQAEVKGYVENAKTFLTPSLYAALVNLKNKLNDFYLNNNK